MLGLQEAGKSSIVLSLMGKINLVNYCSLNPTKGYDIENFEAFSQNYNVWDFGGQESFREEFIKRFSDFMHDCSKLIYVIDTQDIDNYDSTIHYFSKIVELLRDYNYSVSLSVFLHKYDPNLFEIKPELSQEIIDKLIERIKQLIPDELEHDICKTTIYTVFEREII